jgi:hypothetical protein
VPVRLERKVHEEKVDYQAGKVGITNERRAYFETPEALEESDWSSAEGEAVILEAGRIVEVRR